jgi:hypothetical protein
MIRFKPDQGNVEDGARAYRVFGANSSRSRSHLNTFSTHSIAKPVMRHSVYRKPKVQSNFDVLLPPPWNCVIFRAGITLIEKIMG